ncbi:MAG: copper chaperone PCu(A)C [Pseudomonadota bacterium]
MPFDNLKTVRLAAALAATLALGACAEEPPAVVEVEGVVPGLEVTNARLVLAPVSGNPAAIYFDVVYNGERGVSISGAEVEGAANSEVHATMEYNFETTMGESGPVALPGGEPQSFAPGGLHIMAFELDESVAPGSSVEVTLKISGGKTHIFEAPVKAAGDER